jgi:RHS repeat-associated protein
MKYFIGALFLFVCAGKVKAFTISGPTSVDMGETATYTASSVFGCDVDWTVTGGVIVSPSPCNGSTTCTTSGNSITVKWNCVSTGTHRIYAEKAGVCIGTGQIDVTVSVINIAPGTIVGSATVCPSAVNNYSVAPEPVGGVTYTWTTSSGSISGGQGTNTAGVNWSNPGGNRTLTLTTYLNGCATTSPSNKSVFVNTLTGTIASIAGLSTVCAGTSSVSYSVAAVTGTVTYSWTVPPNASIASGQGTNSITVNYPANAQSGQVALTVTNPCSSPVSRTLNVTVTPLPSAAGAITGPVSACVTGNSTTYTTTSILNATSYVWTISGGTILAGNGTTAVNVNWTSAGTRSITVKGSNTCGVGTATTYSVFVFSTPPANNDTITLNHAQIAAGTAVPLIVDHCVNTSLCAPQTIKNAKLYLTFNTGTDYEYGTNTFTGTCTATINGYNAYTGGSQVVSFQKQLTINKDNPEQLFVADFTNVYYQVQRFDVVISGYSSSTLVQPAIKMLVTHKEVFNANAVSQTGSPLITLNAVNTSPAGTNKLTFSWNNSCSLFPDYEFQLLRLYNIDTAKARAGNEQSITCKVDWNNALSIQTQSPDPNLVLSIVEGTGYYVWRVRPIGNYYEGGMANDKNYGAFTSTGAFVQNAVVNVSAGISPYCFFYNQFDKDLNWIYSRFFAEGDEGKTGVKIKETMTYANGLLQSKQTQSLLSTDKTILTGQTIYDFSGRPAMTTMAAPVQQSYFDYVEQFAQRSGGVLYGATHFDQDTNYKKPNPMAAGLLANYYSDNTPGGDLTIPNAEGYPYSRTLYSKDGTNRNAEFGSQGYVHRILSNPNETSHTKKQFYSGVSEEELLRVFGDEAPKANTVHKVIDIDENNTAAIRYVNKEGQSIATCLSAGTNTAVLDTLTESHGAVYEINDLLTDAIPLAPNGMITTKPVAFTTPTTLKVYYKITPKSITADCGTYCSTCDYKVYFILRNILEPDAAGFPKKDSLIIPRGTCPASASSINPYIQYANLAPGSYMVEKRIFTANTNPATGISYLDEAVNAYTAQIDGDVGVYFDRIMEYVNVKDLNGLNTFLQQDVELPLDSTETNFVLNTSCCTILIPHLNCNTPACSASNFEQALIDRWGSDPDLALGTNIKNYFQAPWTSGDSVTTGKFNALVANMIDDPVSPYDCQELWNCWNGIVQGFKVMRQQYDQLGKPYDLLEQFLACAGKKLRGVSNTKNTTSYSSPGYLSHAYAYFKSTIVSTPCKNAINSVAPLSYPYPDTATWHWTQLYDCSFNTNAGGSTNVQSYVDTVETHCNSVCEAHYDGFVQSLLTAYRNDNRYVIVGEGTPNQEQTLITMEEIFCSAKQMVENCKQGCNLTVQGNQAGTPSEILALTKSMTWPYEVSLRDEHGDCASGFDRVSGDTDESILLVDYLNAKLDEMKLQIGPGISSFNVYDAIMEFDPDFTHSCITPSTTVSVSNTIPCYFYLQNTCTLRYVTPAWEAPFICNSICKAHGCLDVCFKWVEPDMGHENSDTVRFVSCEEEVLGYIVESINQQRQSCIDAAAQQYRQKYLNVCLDMNSLDSLKLNYKLDYYHYVLSYYDRVGNQLRTVPPAGVAFLDPSLLSVKQRQVHPNHTLATYFTYNSLGQCISKTTPDAGTVSFYYNKTGQLRFSQSARQLAASSYSYIKYDELARPTEKGKSTLSPSTFSQNVENMSFPSVGTEKTFTVYNAASASGNYSASKPQRNLLNNVSYVYTDKDGSAATTTDRTYTYYSYDLHGNVEWLVQDLPELGKNTMAYEYDLVSRKPLKMIYNEKKADQFMYRYGYDADNRLIGLETSKNGVLWEKDAGYSYYKHGPLKRMVIGEDKVQGLDYIHTIRGSLKGVNHPALDKTIDPGGDGNTGTNSTVALDVFGMMLSYYTDDFKRTNSPFNANATNVYYLAGTDLFNGHITTQVSHIAPKGGLQYEQMTGYTYKYDLLGRLKKSNFNSYATGQYTTSNDYLTEYTYDANGNILTQKRNGYALAALSMDQLTYTYYTGTNRLKKVADAVGTTSVYTNDMENQTATSNYSYDASGNLTNDFQNSSATYWNIDDKIDSVVFNPSGSVNDHRLYFIYDGLGRRVIKRDVTGASGGGTLISQTFYVYDASGILMATYKKTISADSTLYKLDEIPLYGSSRIGMRTESILVKKLVSGNPVTITYNPDTVLFTRTMGLKLYELKDHLDNVRVVINDVKQPENVNNLSLGFKAQIQSYSNYDPFGMQQPGRNYNSQDYRFGFNGKEKDNELLGEGNAYNFDARMYDPRLGRWLSVDPLAEKSPEQSPYDFAFNNPISYIDPDGRWPKGPVDELSGGKVREKLRDAWEGIRGWFKKPPPLDPKKIIDAKDLTSDEEEIPNTSASIGITGINSVDNPQEAAMIASGELGAATAGQSMVWFRNDAYGRGIAVQRACLTHLEAPIKAIVLGITPVDMYAQAMYFSVHPEKLVIRKVIFCELIKKDHITEANEYLDQVDPLQLPSVRLDPTLFDIDLALPLPGSNLSYITSPLPVLQEPDEVSLATAIWEAFFSFNPRPQNEIPLPIPPDPYCRFGGEGCPDPDPFMMPGPTGIPVAEPYPIPATSPQPAYSPSLRMPIRVPIRIPIPVP